MHINPFPVLSFHDLGCFYRHDRFILLSASELPVVIVECFDIYKSLLAMLNKQIDGFLQYNVFCSHIK